MPLKSARQRIATKVNKAPLQEIFNFKSIYLISLCLNTTKHCAKSLNTTKHGANTPYLSVFSPNAGKCGLE